MKVYVVAKLQELCMDVPENDTLGVYTKKENAEKIKAFAGENQAVQAAVTAITAAPAETVVDGLMQALNGAKDAAEGAVDAAQDAAEGAVDAAKDAVQNAAEDAKDAAKQKAGEAVDAAADQAKKALGI